MLRLQESLINLNLNLTEQPPSWTRDSDSVTQHSDYESPY
jgi:hypothetical protein